MLSRQELERADANVLAKMCSGIGNNPSVDPQIGEKALQLKNDFLQIMERQDGWDLDQLPKWRKEVEEVKNRMVSFLALYGDMPTEAHRPGNTPRGAPL